jgi:ribosomal protein S12 methylthiotransferase
MKIGVVSLGCPKNLVDSEVMLGLTEQAGHVITHDAAEADVLIVNTCAFIDRAKQESIDTILEMAQHKEGGACRRLVVTGCLAERYRDELQEQIPEIDAVLGTGEVEAIVSAVEGGAPDVRPTPVTLFARHTSGAVVERGAMAARHRGATHDLPTYLYDAATPRRLTTPGHYAYVKIAEGCDYNCAFCIIPRLRGPYRSRSITSVVEEAKRLADRGVKELLLVSQDTTFYGVDRRERHALAQLLRALNAIDGLHWIRLLYLYPTTITAPTIDAIAECDKVAKYIDLPLQHASDAVLKRMRRPGSRRSYEALLTGLRERIPGVTLRTTLIAGFPGETEADVDELAGFLETVQFDHVGVFTYSEEEGTAAADLPDDVPARTKTARQRRLMQLQKTIVSRRLADRIGQEVEVLVDGPSPEHDLVVQGRLEGQAPEIDPVVYFTDCDPTDMRPGDLVRSVIVDTRDYDVVARPLDS